MGPQRLVSGDAAGPNAVGILVPPARRTFLIVRPRSLAFDLLLLAEAHGTTFRDFDSEQAVRVAEAFFDSLGSAPNGSIPVCDITATQQPDRTVRGFEVRVHLGPFHLLVCRREPGKAYRPLFFVDAEAARVAADQVVALLGPAAVGEQEFYFNTRHFQR